MMTMTEIDTKKASLIPVSRCNFAQMLRILQAYQLIDQPVTPRQMSAYQDEYPLDPYDVSLANRMLYKMGWIDGNRPYFEITFLGKQIIKNSLPDLNAVALKTLFQKSITNFEEITFLINEIHTISSLMRDEWVKLIEDTVMRINGQKTKGRSNAIFLFELLLISGYFETMDYKVYTQRFDQMRSS